MQTTIVLNPSNLARAPLLSGFLGRHPLALTQVKLDDGTGRVVYVPLLTHVDGKDELPDVNMIKVCVCLYRVM